MVSNVSPGGNGKNSPISRSRRIRGALLSRGMTMADLARRHGLTRAMVWKIVHGTRPARRGKSAAVRALIATLEQEAAS